jgi:imidazole glycerol-phosphate synthase subunit HisF
VVAKRIVPCLDVDARGVVKGRRFEGLRVMGDPLELAVRYEAQGADEIVLLRVDASVAGPVPLELVRAIGRALSIPLTVGGGIGDVDRAEALLSAGADRVSVNSLALDRPEVITEMADRFGRQAVVVAMDARLGAQGAFEVYGRGGQRSAEQEAGAWATEAARRGTGELLVTSIDRDGTRSGFDLPLLRRVRSRADVPIVASGGAAGPASFLEAFRAGADAALAASVFHEGTTSVGEVKKYLREHGLEVR